MGELCYTGNCLDVRNTGRFAFLNAVTQHNTHCGQSAPYQVDSRPAVRLGNDGKLGKGRLVMYKTCPVCGSQFDVKPSHYGKRLCCSRKCYAEWMRQSFRGQDNPNYKDAGRHTCQKCGKVFISYNKGRKFCSPTCANSTLKFPKPEAPAPLCLCGCGNPVKWNSRKGEWRRVVCNHRAKQANPPSDRWYICKVCGGKFNGNRTRIYCPGCTPYKNKKGVPNRQCASCGKWFYAVDPKHTTTCSKECNSVRRSSQQKGELSHRWQGGKSSGAIIFRGSLGYAQWRDAVYKRDNYTCQLCGKVGGKLAAHHIQKYSEYPELGLEVDNGITLCWSPCHTNVNGNEAKYERQFAEIVSGKPERVTEAGGIAVVAESVDDLIEAGL